MALFPDTATARLDPFRKHKTLNINFFVHDPVTGEPYSRDPRNVARKAEEYLAASGTADTCYFRGRGRVLHLRLGPVQLGATRGYHHIDSVEGLVEHRPRRGRRQPRLQGGLQGRLLPGAAGRPLRRPARRHGLQPDRRRVRRRARPPRGGRRRPARSTKVQHPAARRRRSDAVQVPHQEHRLARRQNRHLHAEAAVRRQRLGHARATSRCGRTVSRCSTTKPATAGSRTWRGTTSAVCCTTRRACWLSPTRR